MRGNTFLFFYSAVCVTVVFFASAFLNPSPLNFISGVALLPLLIYFWLKMTSASQVSSSKWSLRFILIIFLLSALGIFSFSLRQKIVSTKKVMEEQVAVETTTNQKISELAEEIKALREKDISNEELKAELAKIQEKLNSTQGSFSDILLETSKLNPDVVGYVTIKNPSDKFLDVLDSPNFSAKKVAEIEFGKNYPYTKISESWYYIKLPNETYGWVNSGDVEIYLNQ